MGQGVSKRKTDMSAARIGLLPMYLELYDDAVPDLRSKMEKHLAVIAGEITKRGIDVVRTPVCCVKSEFAEAVALFESKDVDAIVTLHLAYSPSLESAEVLANTDLPIIVLDSTPDFSFAPEDEPELILPNHGIHGVMDMCNMLRRNGKQFAIEAGHWKESDVLDRLEKWIKASRIARKMRTGRIGIIGRPFPGMGDFAVPFDQLRKSIGFESVTADPSQIASLLPSEKDKAVAAELESDRARFLCGDISPKVHLDSVCVGLAVRRWLEEESLSGFTVNFLDVNKASGLPVMPFLEASKAMSRGLGYAGEGDVLTAALVSALAGVFPDTTFAETFCPDWKGDRVFMSHMGEMNVDLVEGKARLSEKDFPFTDADNPAVATGCLRAGRGVLADIAPGPEGSWTLTLVPLAVCDAGECEKFEGSIRGWIRPDSGLTSFLEEYSRQGGTHHQALVYGDVHDTLAKFGKIMGWHVATV